MTRGIALLGLCTAACSQHHDATSDGAATGSDAVSSDAAVPVGELELLVGTAGGQVANQPADWPAAAGAWNAKAPRFDPVHRQIVFETRRADIVGGQIDASATDPDGKVYFVSGPGGGTLNPSSTAELYVANADGSAAHCLTCTDIVDGTDGVEIYNAILSTGAASTPQRQPTGTTIDANRNKDLAFWDPSGNWIIAGVEMPKHGLAHASGNSEVGGYVDVWAISADGKIWVQLTQFADTWTTTNPTSGRPLQCIESGCAAGCQSPPAANTHPFADYACSAVGSAPPTVGMMRPVVSNGASGSIAGSAKIAWSERVGWAGTGYGWGGPLQVATGDLVFSPVGGEMLPSVGSYERNLTPTPTAPTGRDLWAPADGNVIGKGYETWGFTPDDSRLLIASDSFIFTDKMASDPATWQQISGHTQWFTDITSWDYHAGASAYDDLTKYDATVYPYMPNASTGSPNLSAYGHWEEPVAFSATTTPFIAFGTSANLDPAWNPDPGQFTSTFALETWLMPADRSGPAMPITHLSSAMSHWLTYPTAIDNRDAIIYICSEPQVSGGSDQPGAIYRYRVAQ